MADNERKMMSAVFRNRINADRAYQALRDRGYSEGEINVLMSDKTRAVDFSLSDEAKQSAEQGSMATEGMGVGGAIGTAVGATIAAVAAVGTTLAIPGLGLIVAGPLAAALAGGGAGAVTGGALGALIGWGIPEDNAEVYQNALRDGGVVIGVVPRTDDDAAEIERAFTTCNGEHISRA